MTADPPGTSYLEAILIAMRRAAQGIASVSGYLGSAERAPSTPWKWQLLTAAGTAHAEATASLDEADERLRKLGAPDRLPAPLDALPERLHVLRAELRDSEERIQAALSAALATAAGSA
ncbi:MAG: hypothetical protein R3B70_31820 [Polyangiaceae bacterium]